MKTFRSLLILFIFIFGFSLSAETPAFLTGFPSKSYREVISEGQSIGKTEYRWQSKPNAEIEFSEISQMKITLFGKPQEINTSMTIRTNPNMEIQAFDYSMTSQDSQMKIVGTRSNGKLILRKLQAGKEQVKELLVQEPVLLIPMVRPFLLKEGLLTAKETLQRSVLLLEPAALTTIPMTLEAKRNSAGFQVTTTYLSQTLISQLDAKGHLVEERTDFAGIPIVEKSVEAARFKEAALTGTKADLVEHVKVGFPKIENPRGRTSFQVQIEGIPIHNFQLNRHRQKLEGNRLTIEKEKAIESAPVQSLVGKKEFEKYLVGDVSVPVFDPSIQRKAREIVGNENDLWKRAEKIHQFVYKHLEKDPYVSLPDALEALENKKGDCNEHAVLYTALARAAGVPTRTVVGLVYSDSFYGGGQPGFYYHAWVEVFTGKVWVSIDPTWNQIPSDVTHLAFVEGGADQQIQIAGIMGKIKLQPVPTAAVR